MVLASVRAQSDDGRGLPRFIEKEFTADLDCAILARGFARVACRACKHEILVAFSCRGRGLCPSCTSAPTRDPLPHTRRRRRLRPTRRRNPEARPRFVRLDPPTNQEIPKLLNTIIGRVTRLMELRGRFDPSDPDSRLCRYGARPPIALHRLTRLDARTLQDRMKRTFRDGTRTLQFTPEEILTRLSALIPPPRVHLTRDHGIVAPRARRRAALTGRKSIPTNQPTDTSIQPASTPPVTSSITPELPTIGDPPPNLKRPIRLPWADLLRRVHAIDVLCCCLCRGRLRVVAYLTDPDVTGDILDHLG